MGIAKGTYYSVYCDECGYDDDAGDFRPLFPNKKAVEKYMAKPKEWFRLGKKILCLDCYEKAKQTDQPVPANRGFRCFIDRIIFNVGKKG